MEHPAQPEPLEQQLTEACNGIEQVMVLGHGRPFLSAIFTGSADAEAIADDATFLEDLGLDSLSLLEIGVDVDYEFQLGVPEERLYALRSIPETVALVLEVKTAGAPS